MAHVEWSAGIDSVSGALSKPGKNGQHSCAKMLLGTHRVAPTQSDKCNRLFLRKPVKPTLSMTEDSINARQRFAAVRQMVYDRERDLTKLVEDQQAFLAQKDTTGGKRTMKAYYWKVCGDAYDAEHPRA